MTRAEAMVLILSFAKLLYNEVVAGNIKINTPEGYMEKLQEAIELLDKPLFEKGK